MPGEARNAEQVLSGANVLRGTHLTFLDTEGRYWVRAPDGDFIELEDRELASQPSTHQSSPCRTPPLEGERGEHRRIRRGPSAFAGLRACTAGDKSTGRVDGE
jgi:hypothetical protein